ncbi:MAG: MFS transporter [Candidatus Eremiobacteraeota bacterium]|nr:MFS transporter [Candidatus Eremiobacteraeota bacterium]
MSARYAKSASVTPAARRTFIASFLGWMLDAFDFLLLTFVITRIATTFNKSVAEVAVAITLTLACRPIGALFFGWLGDRYGRRTPLMIDIGFYSLIQLLTAFSPNFATFLILRALYGVAMGGEWGLGAALTMESLPAHRRGFIGGMLQSGYMCGFLLAAAAYYGVFTFTHWDWRALFVLGALPALLILYIRSGVPESPVWLAGRAQKIGATPRFLLKSLAAHWPLFVYAIAFMAALNALSHGTQDLYATFLQKQHGFAPGATSLLAIIGAIGAICGSTAMGAISERYGRRLMVMTAAALAGCAIPLWALSHTAVALAAGVFVMQLAVQGCWGVIPAHLNELSPADVRGTFPGFTYQFGNLIAAGVPQIEAILAIKLAPAGGAPNYAAALAVAAAVIVTCVLILTAIGYRVRKENRGLAFSPSVSS